MDRNTITGLVLIVLILVGFNYFTAPSAEEIKAEKRAQDSIAQVEKLRQDSLKPTVSEPEEEVVDSLTLNTQTPDSVQLAAKELVLREKYGAFAPAAEGKGKIISVETEKFRVKFSEKGAQIKDLELKEYQTYGGRPVPMFDPAFHNFNLSFAEETRILNSDQLIFKSNLNQQNIVLGEGDSLVLRFQLPSNESGKALEIAYTIKGDAYDIQQEIKPQGLNNFYEGHNRARFKWTSAGFNLEKHLETEKQRCSVYFCLMDDDRDYLSETSDDLEQIEEPLNWIAFKQNFFSGVMISKTGFAPQAAELEVKDPADSIHTKVYAATAALPNDGNETTKIMWYYGPNDFKVLNDYDVHDLDRIIDFGWAIFGWVNKYFISAIFRFLESIDMGYGLIILVLTIVIKLLLSPLTYKSFVSSAKMRVLKPQIEEINKKHKNADPMKKQQEVMALYRKTGVNPFAGCAPQLLQIPILYAMFRFFPASIELRQESFLWADDLSAYDSILELGFSIPFYGDHVSLFTLLMCLSTLGYTAMNSSQMVQPQQEGMPNMKVMMYIFPIFMLFFFNNFASGLSYYYLTANMLSIAQMFVIKKFIIDEEKILSKIEENKEKNKGKGKSKFQQRLEDMAKQRGYKLPK
ncbi:MAG: membrane protein insertase YidC [Luteibaculum sp.]